MDCQIGEDPVYSGPFVFFFVVFVIVVSQVVVEVVFLLMAPSAWGALESGFSTLGGVANGLIEAVLVSLFEVPLTL